MRQPSTTPDLIGELDDEEQRLVLRDRTLTILHRLGDTPLAESVGDNIDVEGDRTHAANAYRLASCLAELPKVIESIYGRRATGHITEEELDALEVAIYSLRRVA